MGGETRSLGLITGFGLPCGGEPGGSAWRACDFLLLRQKKVTKEKATHSLRPLRCATGQTCVGALAGCAVELTLETAVALARMRWKAALAGALGDLADSPHG